VSSLAGSATLVSSRSSSGTADEAILSRFHLGQQLVWRVQMHCTPPFWGSAAGRPSRADAHQHPVTVPRWLSWWFADIVSFVLRLRAGRKQKPCWEAAQARLIRLLVVEPSARPASPFLRSPTRPKPSKARSAGHRLVRSSGSDREPFSQLGEWPGRFGGRKLSKQERRP